MRRMPLTFALLGKNPRALPSRLPLRATILLAVVALLGPALMTAAQENQTATFHGNAARTGEQPGPNPSGDATLRWRVQTEGAIRSSPVIAGGLLYFGSNDGRLYAVEAEVGEPRWSYSTGGAVRSTPAVADGLVVFGSDDGYVYCLTADTGELQWRFLVGFEELTASTTAEVDLSRRTVTSSPVIVDGVAYIGSNDFSLHALDLDSGIERWHTTFRGPTVSAPAFHDGRLFVGTEDGVWAVDAETGHIEWAAIWGLPDDPNEDENEDRTVDTDADGIPDAEDPDDNNDGLPDDQDPGADQDEGDEDDEDETSLSADLADGRLTVSELMRADGAEFTWNVVAAPVVVDTLVYAVGFQESATGFGGVATVIGTLLQLDVATGAVTGLWYFKTYDDVLTTPAVVGGAIFLGSDRGVVYAVETEITSDTIVEPGSDSDEPSEISFAANEQRWGVQTEQFVGSSPAVVDETVYFGNAGGTLFALSTESGNERWRFQTGGPIWSSPAVANGLVYVGSDDGFLYALGAS